MELPEFRVNSWKRKVTLETKLPGNFRLLVVEERFEQRSGARYLVDEQGQVWRPEPAKTDAKPPLDTDGSGVV